MNNEHFPYIMATATANTNYTRAGQHAAREYDLDDAISTMINIKQVGGMKKSSTNTKKYTKPKLKVDTKSKENLKDTIAYSPHNQPKLSNPLVRKDEGNTPVRQIVADVGNKDPFKDVMGGKRRKRTRKKRGGNECKDKSKEECDKKPLSLICKWGKKKRKKQVGRFMVEDNGPEHCYQFRRKKGWTAQTLIDDRELPKYKDYIKGTSPYTEPKEFKKKGGKRRRRTRKKRGSGENPLESSFFPVHLLPSDSFLPQAYYENTHGFQEVCDGWWLMQDQEQREWITADENRQRFIQWANQQYMVVEQMANQPPQHGGKKSKYNKRMTKRWVNCTTGICSPSI
mgnify:CR=1 FL=1